MRIYLLWFVPKESHDDDSLLIGVYETESLAKATMERLRMKPGFAEYPEGFQIHPRRLNEDSWTDGFTMA